MPQRIARLHRAVIFVLGTAVAAWSVGIPMAQPAWAAGKGAIAIRATELVPVPNPSLSYNTMAQTMGLFAKHGLVLNPGPKLAGGGPARVQAVATNNTDVATGDIIAALGAIYSGAKIKVLMVLTPYGDEEIWGRKKYASMKSAEGQSWAVASLGGAQRFNGQMAIQGMGLDPNDFRWVPIGGSESLRLQAVVTGRTQLASLSHLGAELAENKGYTKQIHVLVKHTAKYTPPIPRLVVVARAAWIKNHHTAATRYVETILDMMRQWQDHADAWVKPAEKIFGKSGLSAEQLHTAWREFRDGGYFSVNGGVNFAATQKVMNLFFKLRKESPNKYLSKPADVYDTTALKTALDKMGVVKGTPGLPDKPDWYEGMQAKKGG